MSTKTRAPIEVVEAFQDAFAPTDSDLGATTIHEPATFTPRPTGGTP